jgi:hypothetical protein
MVYKGGPSLRPPFCIYMLNAFYIRMFMLCNTTSSMRFYITRIFK